MISRALHLACAALLSTPCVAAAQNPNPTNLFFVDLRWEGGRLVAGAPVKLTNDNGTNSQPSFSPDGKAVVFSAQRDTGSNARSDIYRIDLATRAETRVTRTPENENSPTVNERGEYVAVRWQPATLFTEFGPWMYASDGTPTRGVLRAPDTTGYYTPLPNGDYALTRPKSRTFTLGIFDAASGAIVDVDSGIPALPAQRIPGERALSYIQIDSTDSRHMIRRLDLATRRTTTIGPALVGRTAHAWIPGRNTILMAKGNALYASSSSAAAWYRVGTFDHPDLRNASAYVVSPQGDKLILTSQKRLGIATILRDSLEAGMSADLLRAMVASGRARGTFDNVDITEGAIIGVGNDRMTRKRYQDAAHMFALATMLFPNAYRAYGLMGDALNANGNNAGAITQWKKSLELNPKGTDAEKAAAAAIEKKISGQP